MSRGKTNCPTARQQPRPDVAFDATWQAGVSPLNWTMRPLINGEPAPLCFAANPALGWADVYLSGGDYLRRHFGTPLTQRITGRVQLIPVPSELQ